MPVNVHVARTRFVSVDPTTGAVIDKDKASVLELQRLENQHRVIFNPGIPSSAAQPDLKTYLELEAAAGYKLLHLSQNLIVTSDSVVAGAEVHVARLGMVQVNAVGSVLDKTTATIGEMCSASSQIRVLVDPALASTAGNPTLEAYLAAEAALGYVLRHLDQTTIITYGS